MPTPESGPALLSVVVPSYNQGCYLRQTLESILSQSWRPLEVLVIDGASRDETLAVLDSFGGRAELSWISEKDSGPADAVNKGLARARGEVVAIQSADDIYYPGALAAAMEYFSTHPDCGLLWGDADGIDSDGKVFYSGHLPQFTWDAIFATRLCVPQSSCFFRRSLLPETGGWNADFHQCDLDFWLRLLFRTGACKLDRTLSGWRVHPQQRTQAGKGLWTDYCRIIEHSADLRSAAPALRAKALASRHIMALDYPPADKGLMWQRLRALQAVTQFPASRRYIRHHLKRLFPGYALAQRLLPAYL